MLEKRGRSARSAPAEGNGARTVGTLLDERLVKLATGMRVNLTPARLAVVLQARDVGAEEGSELAATARTLTLVTQLVIQHVRLHLDLQIITIYNLSGRILLLIRLRAIGLYSRAKRCD